MSEPKPEREADLALIDQLRAEDQDRAAKIEAGLDGIRLKLFKAVQSEFIPVPIGDEVLKVSKPTEELRTQLVKLGDNVKEAIKAEDRDVRLRELEFRTAYLLEKLTARHQPDLTAEFWLRRDAFPADLPSRIMCAAIVGNAEGLKGEEVKFFRP